MAEQRIERVTPEALARFGLAVLATLVERRAWDDSDGWGFCELAVKHKCVEARIVGDDGTVDGDEVDDCEPGDEVVWFDRNKWPKPEDLGAP